MPVSFYISPQQIQDYDVRRLKMLAGAVLACCIVGSAYAISIILHSLQIEFGISQESLTTVSSVGAITQFFTIPAGILVDMIGPRFVIGSATIVTSIGWILFALVFHQSIGHSAALLTIFDVVLVATTGYPDPACNLNNLFMFSLNRGLIVLVQKTWMGMSTMLLAITYITIFQQTKNSSNNNGDDNNSTTTGSSSSSSSSSSSNNDDEPHNANGMIGYCIFFAVTILVWGGIAFFFLRESPMQKLTRQKTYKQKNNNNEESFCLISERDAKLMEMMEESVGQEQLLEEESNQSRGNLSGEEPPEEENSNQGDLLVFETSDALQAAVIHHVPCDPRIVRSAQIFLILNLIFLSGVSITMLYVTPSRTVGILIAVVSHSLAFLFFLLPLLRQFVWPPTKGLRVTFPNVTRGQVLRWRLKSMPTHTSDRIGAEDDNVVANSLPEFPKSTTTNKKENNNNNTTARLLLEGEQQHFYNARESDAIDNRLLYQQNEDDDEKQQHQQQMVFPNMLRVRFFRALYTSLDLWLLFFAVSAIWGGGSTFISNTIQMYDALAETAQQHQPTNSTSFNNVAMMSSSHEFFVVEPLISRQQQQQQNNEKSKISRDASLTVSLMGAGSGIGRILVGVIESVFLQPKRLSASILLPIPPLLMTASCLIPFVLPSDSSILPLPFVLNALAYGSSWAVVLLSMRQMIAVDVAQFYMFLFLSGVSSLLFGRVFLGPYYDEELHRQQAKPGHCVGIECISVALYVMAIACGISFAFSVVVHWRWMKRNGLGFFGRLPLPSEIVKERTVEEDEERVE